MTNDPQAVGRWAQIHEDVQQTLVEALKARSTEAWAELYTAYYDSLRRYALPRVRTVSEAEDIVSAVFLRALTAIDDYRYEGKPVVAWLYGILQNVLRENRRKLKQNLDASGLTEALQRGHITGLKDVSEERSFDMLELEVAIRKLTPGQREVISLLHLGGFQVKEVAVMLRKSERAVYYLEARALSRLKQELSSERGKVQK